MAQSSPVHEARRPNPKRYQFTRSSIQAHRRPIIIWDTETSGLSPTKNRIVELALLFVNPQIFSNPSSSSSSSTSSQRPITEHSFTTFVRPDDNQRPWYGTGIKWADISRAPTFKEIWPTILHFINSNCFPNHHTTSTLSSSSTSSSLLDNRPIFIAHNLSFDFRFLEEELRRIGETIPSHWDFACSLRDVAHVAWPGQPASLSALVKRLGIQHSAHRALSDSRAVAQVLRLAGCSNTNSRLPSMANKNVYDLLVRAASNRRDIRQSGKSWGNGFAGVSSSTSAQSVLDSNQSSVNSSNDQNVPASVAYVRNIFNARGGDPPTRQ